MLDK
jgi:hypothetical protein